MYPLQFVVAITIVAIVATQLSDVTYNVNKPLEFTQTCSLGQCKTGCSG